jgi:predicted  nucleic acid-binding Zn-ribbon protein
MNDSENKQLDDIHDEVKGSHAQLGAIDERTRSIQRELENISDSVEDNETDIDKLQSEVKRNTTIVGGVTGGLGMVLLWLADKVTRVMHIT